MPSLTILPRLSLAIAAESATAIAAKTATDPATTPLAFRPPIVRAPALKGRDSLIPAESATAYSLISSCLFVSFVLIVVSLSVLSVYLRFPRFLRVEPRSRLPAESATAAGKEALCGPS